MSQEVVDEEREALVDALARERARGHDGPRVAVQHGAQLQRRREPRGRVRPRRVALVREQHRHSARDKLVSGKAPQLRTRGGRGRRT